MTAASCPREPYEWALDALSELDEEGTPIEDPLPVISLRACTGNAFHGNRLLEWRALEAITPPVERDPVEEMIESGLQLNGGRTSWPTCRLADDWDFDAIEERAQGLTGHDHSGVRFESTRQVVWAAISDLEDAIRERHGAIAALAVARFWGSYQVHRHVMRICHELATTETARILRAGPDDCRKAGLFARRWLNTYARRVSMHVAAEDRLPQADQAAVNGPSAPEALPPCAELAENGAEGVGAVQKAASAMAPVHVHVTLLVAQPAPEVRTQVDEGGALEPNAAESVYGEAEPGEPSAGAFTVDLSAELPALAAEGALMGRDGAAEAGSVEMGPREPTDTESCAAVDVATDEAVDPVRAERSQALLAYKAKGRTEYIRVTDPMVANKADGNWHDRSMVMWWKRNDSRVLPPHDRKIRAVLAQDPKTLWVPNMKRKGQPT